MLRILTLINSFETYIANAKVYEQSIETTLGNCFYECFSVSNFPLQVLRLYLLLNRWLWSIGTVRRWRLDALKYGWTVEGSFQLNRHNNCTGNKHFGLLWIILLDFNVVKRKEPTSSCVHFDRNLNLCMHKILFQSRINSLDHIR